MNLRPIHQRRVRGVLGSTHPPACCASRGGSPLRRGLGYYRAAALRVCHVLVSVRLRRGNRRLSLGGPVPVGRGGYLLRRSRAPRASKMARCPAAAPGLLPSFRSLSSLHNHSSSSGVRRIAKEAANTPMAGEALLRSGGSMRLLSAARPPPMPERPAALRPRLATGLPFR